MVRKELMSTSLTGIGGGDYFQRVAEGEYRADDVWDSVYLGGVGDRIWFKVSGNQLQYTWDNLSLEEVATISLTLERVSEMPDEPIEPDEPVPSKPIEPSLIVPELAPSANNVNFEPGEKIILKVVPPTLPEDTVITRTRWEIYFADPSKKGLVHAMEENHGGMANEGVSDGGNGGDPFTYEPPAGVLPVGEKYVHRAQHDFEQAGVKGSTQWSAYGFFSILKLLSEGSSGGGGCDVGLGFFAVGVAALAYLYRKGRGAK
ncbi:MAG: hypothetical protein LBP21_03830 [Synergistaceae bacterium]|nr:hypothetical protein [Synergistaceae bacterium]